MRLFLLAAWTLLPACASAQPPADATAMVRQEILKDRKDTRSWLKSDPTSYLAAVARRDFGPLTTLTVGSAQDNDVRLPGPTVRPHHLRVSARDQGFRVEAVDPGADFLVGKGTQPVRAAELEPEKLGVGRFTLRLSHQGYPAIIVFDPKSPRLKDYHGIRYFPIDPSLRYAVRLTRDPKAETVAIRSTHSADRRATRVGWFEFMAGRTRCRLAATRLLEPGSAPDSLSVLFRDATTGRESYRVGRYVEPKRLPDGTYILDFNMAYNPACAFSRFFNCPIPPRENTLPVAIRAGEQDSHYH
ncbi:MAG: DUF1684 domain-containing protein [Elusimicrobia bacterium]|nr:DUF1684 domain-containing protein [Elusimicrobiota bacterium]